MKRCLTCLLVMGLLHILVHCKPKKCTFTNSIEYYIRPKDQKAIQVLKLLENHNDCWFKRCASKVNWLTRVLIKSEFKQAFEKFLCKHNVSYSIPKPKIPNSDYYYRYIVVANDYLALRLLKRLEPFDYYVFNKYPLRTNLQLSIDVHPENKLTFEKMLERRNVSKKLESFKDDFELANNIPKIPDLNHFAEYLVRSLSPLGIRYIKYLANNSYCSFKTFPARNLLEYYIKIHSDYHEKFEELAKRFNITYSCLNSWYIKPDLHNFCDYIVYARNRKVFRFLRMLKQRGGCIFRHKSPKMTEGIVITIHSDFKDQFEKRVKYFNGDYKLINCVPKRPDDHNFRLYLLKLSNVPLYWGLKRFANETKYFEWKNVRVGHVMRIKIHPEYTREFETVLKLYNADYNLIDHMPKYVNCNNYSAYLARPKDQNVLRVLKQFLIQNNCIYRSKQNGEIQIIEIMVLKELKEKLEEIMKHFNIDYELLKDE